MVDSGPELKPAHSKTRIPASMGSLEAFLPYNTDLIFVWRLLFTLKLVT